MVIRQPTKAKTAIARLFALVVMLILTLLWVKPVEGQPGKEVSGRLSVYDREKGLAFADKIRSGDQTPAAKQQPPNATKSRAINEETRKLIATIDESAARADRESQQVEAEIKRLEQEIVEFEELAKLLIDFKRDETMVRHYLSALFAYGNSQPVKGTMHKLTATKGPVSLTALREFGALEKSERGLLKLGHAGSDPSNDRGRHAFPINIGGSLEPQELDYLAPAQRLLIKYQKLLVLQGLLAP